MTQPKPYRFVPLHNYPRSVANSVLYYNAKAPLPHIYACIKERLQVVTDLLESQKAYKPANEQVLSAVTTAAYYLLSDICVLFDELDPNELRIKKILGL